MTIEGDEDTVASSERLPLHKDARAIVGKLVALLRELATFAQCPEDLIGLAEAWGALAEIDNGLPEILVTVNVCIREGNEEHYEKYYRSLFVSEHGVELNKLYFLQSSNGGDTESACMSYLHRDGSFRGDADEWFKNVRELMDHEGWMLSVDREHA